MCESVCVCVCVRARVYMSVSDYDPYPGIPYHKLLIRKRWEMILVGKNLNLSFLFCSTKLLNKINRFGFTTILVTSTGSKDIVLT